MAGIGDNLLIFQAAKETLAENLTLKGQEAADTESITALANKVGAIEVGGGGISSYVTETEEASDTVYESFDFVDYESEYTQFQIGANDLTAGKTATASSVFSTNVAGRAIDDDNGTAWQPSGSAAHWIRVDLGSGNEKSVGKMILLEHSSYPMAYFYLQGSNDDTNWTTVLDRSGVSAGTSPTLTFVPIDQTAFRYWRLLASWTMGSYYLYNWQLFEFILVEEG